MELRGVGTGWFCIVMLCSGAALVLKEEKPGQQSTTWRDDGLEPTGDPTASTVTPTPPWIGDPVTTPMLTQEGTAGNTTQNASGVPVRYWSPVIFVVVALLVLFFTYRRTKGEGSQDRAASASDSSDLGALDHLPSHDTTPIIPIPQESKGTGTPPAPKHTETTFCQPDPPPPQPLLPQPDTPTTPSGPCCSREPGAD